MPTEHSNKQPQQIKTHIAAGFGAGFLQTAVFFPIDRAIYRAMVAKPHPRPFFHKENFRHPYQSFLPSVGQRSFTAGSYFFLQGITAPLKEMLERNDFSNSQARIFHGLVAGGLNGAINNPFTLMRYYTWGKTDITFIQSAKTLYQAGGMQIFTRGMWASFCRDTIFGGWYEFSKPVFRDKMNAEGSQIKTFFADWCAATLGIGLAAPFNYIRNNQYNADATAPKPAMGKLLADLFTQSELDPKTHIEYLKNMMRMLQLGPGVIRFGLGMAFSQRVCDFIVKTLSSPSEEVNDTATNAPRAK